MGTPAAVKVGPGLIYVAPIGTAEPTSGSGTLPSAWTPIGYTESGSTFTTETTVDEINVAEELNPIRYAATKRVTKFEFQMAEINATNYSIALNGGTIGSPTSGFVTFEPPTVGEEQRLMVVWDGDDDEERMLLRRCLASGSVAIPRQKAPNKALIPITFNLELPDDGSKEFKLWEPDSLSYADVH